MSTDELLDQWIRTIGKATIQAFQDDFSNLSGVSLCLVRLDGTPVTVASNRSLSCFHIEERNRSRCASQHLQLIERMVKSHGPVIASCYAGLTCFACPILRNTEIIGAFFGGMVYCEERALRGPLASLQSSATFMDEAQLQTIVTSLNSTIALLKNVRMARDNTVEETGAALKSDFSLTPREIMVLDQIVQGRSNRDIGETLFISEKTVKTHITNILKKTKTSDRHELSRNLKKYSNS